MTNILVKKFIKDPDDRAAYGTLGSVTGIICNILLSVMKFIIGTFSHSVAITADAVNNLSDTASSVISLLSAKISSRPADKEHPFGHGRMEYVATLILSIAIINVGIEFFKESLDRIMHPSALAFSMLTFILLLVSIGVKLWMYFFDKSLAKPLNLSVLNAAAMDSLFDAVTTSVTVAALIMYVLTGMNIDGIASLIVSVIIIWEGISLVKDTLSPLLGGEMDSETVDKIKEIVSQDPSVIGVHDLVIHSYGPERTMATVHIEISSRMTLEDAHTIADIVERKVRRDLGIVLVVHVDPVDIDDKRTNKIREQIERIIKILDPVLTFHDLHVSFGHDEKIVTFDLVVPYSYTNSDEDRIMNQIIALLREFDPQTECDITIDRGAVEEVRSASK
ncbi:MAG: cation diffusion facilitator family transporter [Lachnospiraceae bacterium]|nr:cation diffusion facilitator family transporter [Lachnospiraceae bacterium]MDD7326844.1 cation diffusion facilitator family transporter [Lachnospiraceae bacterium]MDY2758678.1 cation diffusion facilitator family transporter [Lachnospiraceae bacterium]